MTVTDLRDSVFMQSLGKLASDIIQATIPEEGRRAKGNYTLSRDLRPDEEYVRQTLIAASELINVCEQLDFAVEFLSGYRSTTLKSINLTRLDYITYHLENHLIRTGMLLDRALLFVNVLFQLGLPERECRLSTVADNHHVLATSVGTVIKELDNIIKPYRTQRNVVVHRRRYSDQALEPIEIFYVLQKSNDDLVDNYFFLVKNMTDKVVAAKKDELSHLNEDAFSKIGQLLASSHQMFISKHATLCAG